MTLRRTSSALASMHVFYKADVVIFCEGGQSKTVTDAMTFSGDERTLDNIFWSAIMDLVNLNKRLHFKSVGSKPTLKAIAEDINIHNIGTVTVCLDSDYDRILGTALRLDRVAYTFGYSWESDVISRETVGDVLAVLVGQVPATETERLNLYYSRLESELVGWCEVDISLRAKNKPCVLDRRVPLMPIDITTRPPSVAHDRLRTRLNTVCGYQRRPRKVHEVTVSELSAKIFGKLISKAVYHLVICVAQGIMQSAKIDYDNFMKLAISSTINRIRSGSMSYLLSHYTAQSRAF